MTVYVEDESIQGGANVHTCPYSASGKLLYTSIHGGEVFEVKGTEVRGSDISLTFRVFSFSVTDLSSRFRSKFLYFE